MRCVDLDGSEYTTTYDANGMPTQLQLPGERVVGFKYDAAGRLVAEIDPLGRVTTTAYAGSGLRVSVRTLPDDRTWFARYDLQVRIVKTIDPLGRAEEFEYAPSLEPWPRTRVDARGGRRTMRWDRRGSLLAYVDCPGKVTRYEYDADGELDAVVNALGERTPTPAAAPAT